MKDAEKILQKWKERVQAQGRSTNKLADTPGLSPSRSSNNISNVPSGTAPTPIPGQGTDHKLSGQCSEPEDVKVKAGVDVEAFLRHCRGKRDEGHPFGTTLR